MKLMENQALNILCLKNTEKDPHNENRCSSNVEGIITSNKLI